MRVSSGLPGSLSRAARTSRTASSITARFCSTLAQGLGGEPVAVGLEGGDQGLGGPLVVAFGLAQVGLGAGGDGDGEAARTSRPAAGRPASRPAADRRRRSGAPRPRPGRPRQRGAAREGQDAARPRDLRRDGRPEVARGPHRLRQGRGLGEQRPKLPAPPRDRPRRRPGAAPPRGPRTPPGPRRRSRPAVRGRSRKSSPSASRSRPRARWSWAFDVPTAMSIIRAISSCLYPSTSWSTNTARAPGGSTFIAAFQVEPRLRPRRASPRAPSRRASGRRWRRPGRCGAPASGARRARC